MIKEVKFDLINTGKPSSAMTDEQWQIYFNFIRLMIQPSLETHIKYGTKAVQNNIITTTETEYSGETNWSTYRSYINDVLLQIRSGNMDYCYYIYQIIELLKYENNTLKTRYIQSECYFEVWI